MRFSTFPILLLALVANVVAADGENTPDKVKCDTAAQANLADCEVLLNRENDTVWKEKWDNWHVPYSWHYRSAIPFSYGFRTACNGRCCVFVHFKDQQVPDKQDPPDQDSVRLKAIKLLESGCINRATGLINAVGLFDQGEKDEEINICIGNVQSGNDCFDDEGDAT